MLIRRIAVIYKRLRKKKIVKILSAMQRGYEDIFIQSVFICTRFL